MAHMNKNLTTVTSVVPHSTVMIGPKI